MHLCQYHVAARTAALGVAHRVEERWVLTHADQCCRLGDSEVFGRFAEIGLGCCLDADGVMQEVEVVQIEVDDFLFGVATFQLDGYHPFNGFLEQALRSAVCGFRIELLGQLLSDGGATAGAGLPQDAALDNGASQCDKVDARMVVEPLVFSGHQGMHQMWRQTVVVHADAVLAVEVPGAQHLSVGGVYLSGKPADGVLQVLHGGHIANPSVPYSGEGERPHNHHYDKESP